MNTKKSLVVVFSEPLAVPDDLIGDARRLNAEVLANDSGELLVFFPDMRQSLCRSFLNKADRYNVAAKRGYRVRPQFTLRAGMDELANRAYVFGAQTRNHRLMRFGAPKDDLACPWCGFVGKVYVHIPQVNQWAPDQARSTTVACRHCNREATVEEHVPPSHQHELIEWLEGIARVEAAYETDTHKAIRRQLADEIARATPERRRLMGLGPSPTGNHSKRNGPLSRPAQGPRRPT